MVYPPKNSSAPSPDSTTVTCSAAFFGPVGRRGMEPGLVVAPGGEHPAGLVGEALPGPDPTDALVQGARLGHVLQRQVVRQRGRLDARVAGLRGRRERQQRLLLAGQV